MRCRDGEGGSGGSGVLPRLCASINPGTVNPFGRVGRHTSSSSICFVRASSLSRQSSTLLQSSPHSFAHWPSLMFDLIMWRFAHQIWTWPLQHDFLANTALLPSSLHSLSQIHCVLTVLLVSQRWSYFLAVSFWVTLGIAQGPVKIGEQGECAMFQAKRHCHHQLSTFADVLLQTIRGFCQSGSWFCGKIISEVVRTWSVSLPECSQLPIFYIIRTWR